MTLSRLLLLSILPMTSVVAESSMPHAMILREAVNEQCNSPKVDLSNDPVLMELVRSLDLEEIVALRDCPALNYLHHCMTVGDCHVPASIIMRALEELNELVDSGRSFGSIKQIYAIGAELAALGLGANFVNTATPNTTLVGPQFSMVATGVQTINIGTFEGTPAGTAPSIVNIGNANPLSVVNVLSPIFNFPAGGMVVIPNINPNACATAVTTTTDIADQNSNTVDGEQVINIGVGQNIVSGNACNSTQGVTLNAANNVLQTTDSYVVNLGLQSSAAATGSQTLNLGVGQAGSTQAVTLNAVNNNAASTGAYLVNLGINSSTAGGIETVNIGNNVALVTGASITNIGVQNSSTATGSQEVNIGTGAGTQTATVNIGNRAAAANSVNILGGATGAVNINNNLAGTATPSLTNIGINISAAAGGTETVNIASNVATTTTASLVNIGLQSSTAAGGTEAINIGTGAGTQLTTVVIGNVANAANSVVINAGATGDVTINAEVLGFFENATTAAKLKVGAAVIPALGVAPSFATNNVTYTHTDTSGVYVITFGTMASVLGFSAVLGDNTGGTTRLIATRTGVNVVTVSTFSTGVTAADVAFSIYAYGN